jgi:lipid II:glycine glycyltransferase (peptidoglycan interpeptide bridge formation enzyme)
MTLDISDPECLWARFYSNVRNKIRKAERSSVQYERSTDTSTFYHLYELTFRNRGITVTITQQQLSKLIEELQQCNSGDLYLARSDDGKVCAGAVMTWHADQANYFLSASHPERRQNGSVAGLLWYMIRDLSGRFGKLDLVGANLSSIAQFKNQFNPDRVEYEVTQRYQNRFRRYQHSWYRTLRRTRTR